MMKLKHIICSVIVGTLLLGTCACSSKKAKTTLTYIGHASVKIVASDGTVLYIDPNYQGDYSQNADYIIVTHKHDDHMPNATLKLNDNGQKFDNSDFLHDGIYETMDLGPFKVEAVPAGGNPNHDVKYCVGYLVTVDGVTIYHAGDTSMIDQMKDLQSRDIDYAMYPIDGVFNMDAKEATEVATLVGAKSNIPIHEFDQNGSKKSDNFTPEGRLVLEYGQTIEIGK